MDRSHVFEATLIISIIVLVAVLCYFVASSPGETAGWETDLGSNVDYMFVGSDDTLYTFSGNTVAAVSSEGNVLWNRTIPSEWKVLSRWDMPVYSTGDNGGGKSFGVYPIVAESDGSFYIFAICPINGTDVAAAGNSSEKVIGTDYHYLSPDIPYVSKPAVVMKISPEGNVTWNYTFLTNLSTFNIGGLVSPDLYTMEKPIAISVSGNRVYVFHDYAEDVLDADGRLLFTIRNVSAPVAVDGAGRIYAVRAVQPTQEQFNQSMKGTYMANDSIAVGWDSWKVSQDLTYMLTTSVIDAYAADGSPLWSCDIGENATRPFLEKAVWQRYNTLPLLSNGQLYVPVENGVVAVSLDGKVNWTAHLGNDTYTFFSLMPIDVLGNVYMMRLDPEFRSAVTTISRDGQISDKAWKCYGWPYGEYRLYAFVSPVPIGARNGTAYAFMSEGSYIDSKGFEDMLTSKRFYADTVYAYDLSSGKELWGFTLPAEDVHVVTLNHENVDDALLAPPPFGEGMYPVPTCPSPEGLVEMYPGKDVLYLSYYYAIYESPLYENKSRCIYARGFYALDNDGKLLWEIHSHDVTGQVAAGNHMVYYSLGNGRIGGKGAQIAAGAAITAFAYLFLRFFAVGTVTRARGRIGHNENRNQVLRYIVDYPGVTAADVARELKINMGTIRYHLFVLTANHKIVTYKDSEKFLRYFRNAGTYTEEEKEMLSLVRRRPLQKVLLALLDEPERSCADLARELDISVAAASRHVTELADRGIIEKIPGSERGFVYSIRPEHKERIKELLGRS